MTPAAVTFIPAPGMQVFAAHHGLFLRGTTGSDPARRQ